MKTAATTTTMDDINARNRYLIIAATFLLGLSLFTFYKKHFRKDIEIVGTDFLPMFDPMKIGRIEIQTPKDGTLVLVRENDMFRMASDDMFYADNSKMNDFFYFLANIHILETVAEEASENLLEENQLSGKNFFRHIILSDVNGKELYNFIIGKGYKTAGHFIRLNDQKKFFLSSETLYPFYRSTQFLNSKNLYKFENDKIDKVEIASAGKVKESVKRNFEFLKYDEHYSLRGEKKNLSFDNIIRWRLKDKSNLEVAYARERDKVFFKANLFANSEDLPEKIVLEKNADEKKLLEVDSLLKLRDKIANFQRMYKNYIFSLKESDFKTLLETENAPKTKKK